MTHSNKLVDYCDISCETGGFAEEKDQASNGLFGVPRFRDSPKTHIKAENRQILMHSLITLVTAQKSLVLARLLNGLERKLPMKL